MIIISVKDIEKKEQHAHAHRLLRECLKKYGISYSENTAVEKNRYGKPSLRDYPEIFYNLSHSEGIAACIVSDKECGIDCEKIREPHFNVMKRCFTEKEAELVMNSDNKNLIFFQIWTLKESYIKAIGTGISFPLKEAEFLIENGEIITNIKDYRFRQHIIENGKYAVSVCKKAADCI